MTNSINFIPFTSKIPSDWANDVNDWTYGNYQNVKNYGALGLGPGTDDTAAFIAATGVAGVNGSVFLPPGNYFISSTSLGYVLSCAKYIFAPGAQITIAPGSQFIFDFDVEAGDYQIFNTGKWATACDCDAASTTLRCWNYFFNSSDVGQPVSFLYGGQYTGAPAVGNFVQGRLPYNTTITGFTAGNQISVAAGPVTPIRQDYVFDQTYAYANTGVVVVGNGFFSFTTKITQVNVQWFGTDNTGHSINKALFSLSREFGGSQVFFPNGTYGQSVSILVDTPNVTLKSNAQNAILFRQNNVPLQQMNSIQGVWRGRYGGGGQVISSENWTFGGSTPVWQGDWELMAGLTVDGLLVNGNQANQPAITPGTGIDSWDSGLSTYLVSRVLIKSTCSFVNTLRWGAAISTICDDSHCEDGVYFNTCNEGGFYCEVGKRITCGQIHVINSPAAGWNMGAVTFSDITGGSINSPVSIGGNNGIYIRNGSTNIDCTVGTQLNCLNNAVWVYDETNGSNPLTNISIKGGSVAGSSNGVVVAYTNKIGIEGVKGSVTGNGINIIHSTQFDIVNCAINGVNYDINLGGGIVQGYVSGNQSNVQYNGTSATSIGVNIVGGYAWTNSGSGIGNLALNYVASDGAGNAIQYFNSTVTPFGDNVYSSGTAGNRWSVVYAASGAISTSDENEKEQIQSVYPAVLRAWGKINYAQWMNKSAVIKKGKDARIHHGLIAQQIEDCFKSEGLDPFAYGLLCKDKLEDGTERYGVRYEEALSLECAYLRSLVSAEKT